MLWLPFLLSFLLLSHLSFSCLFYSLLLTGPDGRDGTVYLWISVYLLCACVCVCACLEMVYGVNNSSLSLSLSLCHSIAGGLKRGSGVMGRLIRSQEGHLSVVSFNYSLDKSMLYRSHAMPYTAT